jgi:hypothetical protein
MSEPEIACGCERARCSRLGTSAVRKTRLGASDDSRATLTPWATGKLAFGNTRFACRLFGRRFATDRRIAPQTKRPEQSSTHTGDVRLKNMGSGPFPTARHAIKQCHQSEDISTRYLHGGDFLLTADQTEHIIPEILVAPSAWIRAYTTQSRADPEQEPENEGNFSTFEHPPENLSGRPSEQWPWSWKASWFRKLGAH